MTRWENEELWDADGNDLSNTPGVRAMPRPARPHQHLKRDPHCGYFRCPACRRVMPFCWGASDGPECDECWARDHAPASESPKSGEAVLHLAGGLAWWGLGFVIALYAIRELFK